MTWLSCVSMYAQSSFHVSGTVVEKETGEAVVAATMQLLALPDSTFVEGTATGSKGEFNFKNVKNLTFQLTWVSTTSWNVTSC